MPAAVLRVAVVFEYPVLNGGEHDRKREAKRREKEARPKTIAPDGRECVINNWDGTFPEPVDPDNPEQGVRMPEYRPADLHHPG